MEGVLVSDPALDFHDESLLAETMQHETGHLNGNLFISLIRPLRLELIKGKIRNLQKARK